MVTLMLIFKLFEDDENKIDGFRYGWNHRQG
jgi:hypothetical protein